MQDSDSVARCAPVRAAVCSEACLLFLFLIFPQTCEAIGVLTSTEKKYERLDRLQSYGVVPQ